MTSASLVIFDCDGVIVESEELVNQIEAEYFTGLGIPMTAERCGELFAGKTVPQVAATIVSMQTRPLPADWMYDWAMAVALGFSQRLHAVDGIAGVLEDLRCAAVPFCIASQSTAGRVALSLHATRLAPYFDGPIFTADMVANPKPAPDLFVLAAARMKTPPERCIVVEDSAGGARAAKSLGMRVFGYGVGQNAADLAQAGAEVFSSMRDLPRLLGLGDRSAR